MPCLQASTHYMVSCKAFGKLRLSIGMCVFRIVFSLSIGTCTHTCLILRTARVDWPWWVIWHGTRMWFLLSGRK